uniref:Ig-like domain-containing protein n=1 Tax=Chelonoidis abingdonii TaxID=106734 RepID=A0A8C0GW24_CHEAB
SKRGWIRDGVPGAWLGAGVWIGVRGSYPKPSISVSPSEVIPVGGNVTIWCWHQLLDMRILLYKDEDENYLHYTDPAGSEAEFPITSARREHGGSYTCRYSNRTGEVAYSEPSDPVQIIVAGEGPSPAPRLPAPHPARPQGVSASAGMKQMGHWDGDRVTGGFPTARGGFPRALNPSISVHPQEPGSGPADNKISLGDELLPLGG